MLFNDGDDFFSEEEEKINKQIKLLEEEKLKLKNKERINSREKALLKYTSRFPPGFIFEWNHRHDPFESYYRLRFEYKDTEMSWDFGDETHSELEAREFAWKLFEQSVAICAASELVRGI